MKRKRWTKHDDARLALMWKDHPVAHIADIFRVSESSVLHRARRLNLKSRNGANVQKPKAFYSTPSMPFVPIGRD